MSDLVPRPRLEHFLKELANSGLDPKAGMRLKRLFPEFLGDLPTVTRAPEEWAEWLAPLQRALGTRDRLVSALTAGVRGVWADPDARSREWRLFLLRLQLAGALVEEIEQLPPLTPLDQALAYLQHEGRRAKRCANQNCPAPYFFASRKNQKFCGDECAAPAKKEAKLRWWHDPKNRAKRKRKSQ